MSERCAAQNTNKVNATWEQYATWEDWTTTDIFEKLYKNVLPKFLKRKLKLLTKNTLLTFST